MRYRAQGGGVLAPFAAYEVKERVDNVLRSSFLLIVVCVPNTKMLLNLLADIYSRNKLPRLVLLFAFSLLHGSLGSLLGRSRLRCRPCVLTPVCGIGGAPIMCTLFILPSCYMYETKDFTAIVLSRSKKKRALPKTYLAKRPRERPTLRRASSWIKPDLSLARASDRIRISASLPCEILTVWVSMSE